MGKPSSFKDEYVIINGCNHFIVHDYQNENQAILLYVHGGPGEISSIYAPVINEGLNETFHIVHYDQRGSGRTYLKNKRMNHSEITMEVLLNDLHGVINYLKDRYHQERIILLGHSFGSLLASLYCLKYPNNIEYYIGVGQLIGLKNNEEMQFNNLKRYLEQSNNAKFEKEIEAIGQYPLKTYEKEVMNTLMKIRKIQRELGLLDEISKAKIKKMKKGGYYNLRVVGVMKRILENYPTLFKELYDIDLNDYSNRYQNEIYYLLGKEDANTPTIISESYFERLESPHKRLFLIEGAKHLPMLTHQKNFVLMIDEIHKHHLSLKDKQSKPFYESIADYYDTIFSVNEKTVECLKKMFNAGRKLLDIGCATGGYAKALYKEGYLVDGIDLDEKMIEIARNNEEDYLRFFVYDMLNLNFNEEYDGIYCIGNTFVHLLDEQDVLKALKNMYHALKENSKVVLMILNYDRILDSNIDGLPLILNGDVSFIRQYTKEGKLLSFNTTLLAKERKIENRVLLNPIRYFDLVDSLRQVGFKEIKAFEGDSFNPYQMNQSYHLRITATK